MATEMILEKLIGLRRIKIRRIIYNQTGHIFTSIGKSHQLLAYYIHEVKSTSELVGFLVRDMSERNHHSK